MHNKSKIEGQARIQQLLILGAEYDSIIHNMNKYYGWSQAQTNSELKKLNAFELMPEIYGQQQTLLKYGGV